MKLNPADVLAEHKRLLAEVRESAYCLKVKRLMFQEFFRETEKRSFAAIVESQMILDSVRNILDRTRVARAPREATLQWRVWV